MGDISVKGHSPILRQGFAKGGRAGHLAGGPAIKAGKRFLDFIKTGKHVDKHGVKTNLPKAVERLKKQGSPHLETYKESVKKTPRIKKATGGVARGTRKAAETFIERVGGGEKAKPHSTKEGRIASGKRKLTRFLQSRKDTRGNPKFGGKRMGLPSRRKDFRTHGRDVPTMAAKGGRAGFAIGGRGDTAKRLPSKRRGTPQKTYRPLPKRNRKLFDTSAPPRRSISDSPRTPKMLQSFKKGGKADKNWMQKVNKSIKRRGTKGKCTPITKPGCTGRAKALAKTFKKIAAKRKGKVEGGRIDVPPSSQWKKPADKNLKPGQAKDAMEQYKKQPKKLKLRCG